MTSPFDRLVAALDAGGFRPIVKDRKGTSRCPVPAHGDTRSSLSLGEGRDGRGVVHCFAGCRPEEIVGALGMKMEDLFATNGKFRKRERFEVRDAAGKVQAIHDRIDNGGGDKACPWLKADGTPSAGTVRPKALPLYGSERLKDWPVEESIVLCEGEGKTDRLVAAGIHALGSFGADSLPEAAVLETLRDRRVVLWPDADTPGRVHMAAIALGLRGVAAEVRSLELWPGSMFGYDAAEALDLYGGAGVAEVLADAPLWTYEEPVPFDIPPEDPPPAEPGTKPKAPPPKDGPILVILDTVKAEPVRWLSPGRLAIGKITLFDGDPGQGKTTIVLDLAARLSSGAPFPGESLGQEPAGVVVVSLEDGIGDTIRPRIEVAGGDLKRIAVLREVVKDGEERTVSVPEDIGAIREAVRRVKARLVILDPFSAVLSGAHDSYRDQDVRRALSPLAQAAEEDGFAVALVRHLTKGGGRSALYRGQGSIGVIGQARLAFLCAERDGDPLHYVAAVKTNVSALAPTLGYRIEIVDHPDPLVGKVARIAWEPGTFAITADELVAERAPEEKVEIGEAGEWLREYFGAESEVPAKEALAAGKAAGFSESALRRARKRLGFHDRREGFGAGGRFTWIKTVSTTARPIDATADPSIPYIREPMVSMRSMTPMG